MLSKFIEAAGEGNLEFVKQKISQQNDEQIKEAFGLAAREGHVDIVEFLWDKAPFRTPELQGIFRHSVVANGKHVAVVKCFLEHKIDISWNNFCVINTAADAENLEILETLLYSCGEFNADLGRAAKCGWLDYTKNKCLETFCFSGGNDYFQNFCQIYVRYQNV